jgi:peptide/nickel transport system substrate-binding protein
MIRLRHKVAVFVVLALIAGSILAPAALFAQQDETLVVIQGAEPPGLDPVLHREGPTYNVTINIFDSLLRKTRAGRNVPALAARVERDSDTSWVFHLREDVTFHNGEPLTAEAVQYTVERILDPDVESTRRSDFEWMDRVEIIDESTVRFVANEPFALAEHYFTELQIVPPGYFENVGAQEFNESPVGTGPFELVRWDRGNRIVLERNEDYWRGPSDVERVEFRFVPSAASRVATLLSGRADLIADPPISARGRIDRNPNARFETATGTRVMFVGLDAVQDSPLSNRQVRQALNYAVDKRAIIENLLFGLAEQTTTLLTDQDFGFNEDVDPYPYDPERARELLEDAGYDDGFEITLDTVSGRYINDETVAQAIAGYLGEVGITVNVNVLEFGAFNDRLFSKQTSPMYLVGWGNPVFDPAFIYDFVTRSGSLLRTIENPEIDELLAEARSTTNQEQRRRVYGEVMPLINEAAPAIFLYKQPVLFGLSDRLDWEPRSDEFLLMYDAELD